MSNITLTLPDSNVFEFDSYDVEYDLQAGFLVSSSASGLSGQFVTLVDDANTQTDGNGYGQNVFLPGGSVDGSVQLTATVTPASNVSWGGYSGSDAEAMVQHLHRALNTTKISSLNPATFEHPPEYTSGGAFGPIDVVVGNAVADWTRDGTNEFRCQLTLFEANDSSNAVDALLESVTGKDGET